MCLYVLSVKGWGGRENIWTQECACGWMATYPAVLLLDVHDQIARFAADVAVVSALLGQPVGQMAQVAET
jgi:hypothetical protein